MNKYIILTSIILLMAVKSIAQELPDRIQRKISGLKRLDDIMRVVDAFYREEAAKEKAEGGRGEEKEEFESGHFLWQRWAYFNKTRLKDNGELEDIAAKTIEAWNVVNSKYGDAAHRDIAGVQSSSNAAWNFIGPFANSYQNGFYRGLSKTDRIVFHATDPNTFFVCAHNGGLWRTQNGGASWVNLTRYFPIQSISGVAVDPGNAQRIFVLTGDGNGGGAISQNSCGIWFTTNGGNTWTQTSFNRSRQTRIFNGFKLVMLPGNVNTLFAATQSGLYRSTDGGNNWNRVLTGVALTDGTSPVYDIEFDPSSPSTVYVSGFGRFYRSLDGGATFPADERTNIPGANRIEIGVSPNNNNYVYLMCAPFTGAVTTGNPPVTTFVGTSNFSGLYRSPSKGSQNSFTARATSPNVLSQNSNGIVTANDGDQSNYDLAIAASPVNAETVVVAGKIVWRSTDGGTTLTNLTTFAEPNTNPVAPANYIHPDIHDLAYNPLNNNLYCCNDGGVYVSTNGGNSWADITNGISTTTFYHMSAAAYDVNKIMGGTQDNGMKYKKNAGEFLHVNGGDGFDCAFGNSANSPIYATNNNGVVKYNNNGDQLSVTTPANTTNLFPVITVNPADDDIVYLASSSSGVFKSTNGGSSWTQILNLAIQQSICNCPSNSNRIYVAGTTGIYRTDNAGAAFTGNLAANPGFAGSGQIADVNVCPANSNYVYVAIGGYTAGAKVMTSNDAGATWINISGTLPAEVKVSCLAVDNGNNVYIGTDMGVYYHGVTDADWTPYFNELPRCPVTDLFINQAAGKIRASTYGAGIWEADLYSACDFSYAITGDNNGEVFGNRFYQASDNISAYVTIKGTDSTLVTARAGREIILGNGFSVAERSRFNGLLGPCQSGLPPQRTAAAELPVFVNSVDKGNSRELYPYGTLSVVNGIAGGQKCIVTAHQTGAYKIVVTNAADSKAYQETTIMAERGSRNETVIGIDKLQTGQYFVKLIFDNKLVHYQELFIKQQTLAKGRQKI